MSDADSRPASDTLEAVTQATEALRAGADEAAAHAAPPATNGKPSAADSAARRAGDVAHKAGGVLTDAASTVSEHAPAVIDASRATAGAAIRQVRGASSDDLMRGAVFSTGLALGLIVGRVPRALVLAALTPVFVMGGTLLSRRGGGGPTATGAAKGSK